MRWIYIIFAMPRTFATSYSIAMIGLRVFIFQFGLSKIYSKIPTKINPLHEDGAGGYAAIGKAVGSYLIWVLAGSGFYLSSGVSYVLDSLNHEIPNFIIWQLITLPVFATIAFFWPLLSTREEMLRSIRRNLAMYSDKYNTLEANLTSPNKAFSERQLRELDGIIELTNKIRKTSPKWPFNTQVFNGFLATLGTTIFPLLITVMEQIILPRLFP